MVDAAGACVTAGERCLQHCSQRMGGGDASLAECAQSVYGMLAVNAALKRLALTGSPHLAEMARVAATVSRGCETE